MKIGIIPINIGAQTVEQMIAIAQKAEQVGVESIWTFEHVIVPEHYESKYPYNDTGKMGVPPETNFVDPLISLAAIAAATERVKLGTGVNILPQANPLLMAKQAASLDFVSNGRFMLGLGIGWLREEFVAMGVPFERRGARFDDYLEAMKQVWSGARVEHRSEFLDWSGFKSHPTPRSLEIVIGGSKGKAFLRTARFGDGYFAPNQGVQGMKDLLVQLEAACRELGRARDTIEVTGMWAPALEGPDAVRGHAELGVARLVVPLMGLQGDDAMRSLDELGETIARL